MVSRRQHRVEATRGPALPASAHDAIALLEDVVIPHFDYLIKLQGDRKILAGGLPVGDRAFVCIIEATSNDDADRIVRDMPLWGVFDWKVTPLQSVAARKEIEQAAVQKLRATSR